MKTLKIICIGVIVSVFLAGQAYGAPKGNNGNGKNGKANNEKNNNGNSNNAQPNVIRTINSRPRSAQVKRVNRKPSGNRGKSALKKRKARRASEASRNREERNRKAEQTKSSEKRRITPVESRSRESRAEEFLSSLEQARQKNMFIETSKHDYIHKTPDRAKNNKSNRNIPQNFDFKFATRLDFQIYDSLVKMYQKTADYYQSIIDSGVLTPDQADYYRGRVRAYLRNIDRKRSKEYISVGLMGDNTIGYRIDLTKHEHFKDRSLHMKTSLILRVDFISYEYTWNERTGTWYIEGTSYLAGDEFIIQSEFVKLTGKDKTYEFKFDPDAYFIKGNNGGFFDMVTTVTDTQAGEQIKRKSDKSLYIYRDPYGKVEDSVTQQSIVGAEITIYNLDGSIVVLDKAANPNAYNPQVTDATGRFAFNLRTDRKYYMTVKASGYEDYQSGVFTEKWHVIREDIRLTPATDHVASNF